jgi:hypothetical protein
VEVQDHNLFTLIHYIETRPYYTCMDLILLSLIKEERESDTLSIWVEFNSLNL